MRTDEPFVGCLEAHNLAALFLMKRSSSCWKDPHCVNAGWSPVQKIPPRIKSDHRQLHDNPGRHPVPGTQAQGQQAAMTLVLQPEFPHYCTKSTCL